MGFHLMTLYCISIMKCNQGGSCYFFQDCQLYPELSLCHEYCELSAWFIQVVIWSIVLIIGILMACYHCQYCPLNWFLFQRGNITEDQVLAIRAYFDIIIKTQQEQNKQHHTDPENVISNSNGYAPMPKQLVKAEEEEEV